MCAVRRLRNAQFDAPAGGDATLTVPLQFSLP
jgi:hypothetical protein